MVDGVPGRDFFISYAGENRVWAEWIAVQLEQAGFTTVYQAADFRPGRDFVQEMQQAVVFSQRTIAVLSPAYLRSQFSGAEWRAVFAQDPTGEKGLLIPVRVQPCDPPGFLATRIYVDLVGVGEAAARKKVLAAVDRNRPRPSAVRFPGGPGTASGVRFPGAGPAVTNLGVRNLVFTGREEQIQAVYEALRAPGSAAAVVSGAVHGLGGVGKSALAVEYAYRFGSDYDVVWWIAAELPGTVAGQVARLARRLGLPEVADEQDAVAAVFDQLRGMGRWLLIYDNAEQPASLSGVLPAGGDGRVLVTSRWPDWRAHAHTVELPVWPRLESVAFLQVRTRHRDPLVLGELAGLVGDLPLAVEEAAAYLEQTGEDLAVYVALVRDRLRELFAVPGSADERRVGSVWTLSLNRVHASQPVAEQLLTLLAFLGPQVPRDLPTKHPDVLPAELGAAVGDRLVYNRLLEAVGRYALVSLNPDGIGMHRLVQAVVQARTQVAEEEARWATIAVELIRRVFPDSSWEPASWPLCQMLIEHLLVVTDHAERLQICGEQAGWLLARASAYLRKRGQYRQAEPLARRALDRTRAVLGPHHFDTAERHDELGRVLQDLGRLDEALAQFEQALSIGLAALGPDHPDIGARRGSLGLVLQDLGRLDDALAQFEQALSIGLAALGPGDPIIGTRRNNLGLVLQNLGRLEDAHAQYEQALSISLAALGPDHPDIGTWRNNLGLVLRDLGRLDEALTQLELALRNNLAALGPDHPIVGARRGNLGSVLRELGRLEDAHAQLDQALSISLGALGPDHPDIGIWRNNLGLVLWDLDRLEDAHAQFEQALRICLAALGPDHRSTRTIQSRLDQLVNVLTGAKPESGIREDRDG
ncbi:FxSxx-COOH system tetratricopeptide repeat protein [Actinoplanes missouriensis]|uniref:FxSxx-COOH system tetratricopeptide repeat protein n=1 Tax=Actinoplanes missouriensis TaxID=1866 RepID=UPI0033DD980B